MLWDNYFWEIILWDNYFMDNMLWENYVFIGTYSASDFSNYITARTNNQAVNAIKNLFPNKTIIPFELLKSNDDPRNNALHLDCCLQPVGKNKAIAEAYLY